ncbi:MAG: acetolactate synthase large subunit, partial [Clostridia bacterium]|nr:acetolactate synthase large subunit [Clostridia bacterium]
VVFLMNNGVLGMVRQWQNLFFDKHFSETVLDRATDFVALARAFGADGMTATTLSELETALDKAFSANGPFIVDCRIDKDEFVLPMLPPGGCMDDIITKVGD